MPQLTRDPAPGVSLWLPVALYMAVIFTLSSVSNPPDLPTGSDKSAHVLIYAGLSALLVRALAGGRLNRVTFGIIAAAILLSTFYGLSDEYHQRFVPGRSFELGDLFADTLGSAVAAGVIGLWGRMRHAL